VDESGVIPSRHHDHNGPPCSHITPGMNNRRVGGRSFETQSHPIMINQSILISRLHIVNDKVTSE
jgi:hypothetical protein